MVREHHRKERPASTLQRYSLPLVSRAQSHESGMFRAVTVHGCVRVLRGQKPVRGLRRVARGGLATGRQGARRKSILEHRRRRVPRHAPSTFVRPEGYGTAGAICCIAAPRRWGNITFVVAPCIWCCGARNVPAPDYSDRLLRLGLELSHFLDQCGHDLEEIAHDPVVGHLEDRRLGVLVDRDDDFRGGHPGQVLDRAGDSARDV